MVGSAVAVALASPALVGVSLAQEQQEDEVVLGLEEIVVTARKREESLQDQGSSVSAIGPTELGRRFDLDLQTFANAAPNVIIDDLNEGPGNQASISIRGIGVSDLEKSFDPAVGVVIDGVFIGSNAAAMIKALDLQSMEILRGPQGTLFGRNSIAGVINVTRRKPDPNSGFTGEIKLAAGNYDDRQLDGFLNIPVTQDLAFKVAGAWRERDGYLYNSTVGQDSGDVEYSYVSPSVLWRPTENLEFFYRFDKSWQDQDANAVQNMAQPDQVFCFYYLQCAQSVSSPQSGDRYVVVANNEDPNAYFDSDTHIFQGRWDVSESSKFEYVFGHMETDEVVNQDFDGTPLVLYETERPATYKQSSHELRYTHASGGPLAYTVGAYLWESEYRINLTSYIGFGDFLYGLPAGTVLTVPQTVEQKTESSAVFFEGDYRFNEAWTLTLGGRYTRDEKSSGLIDPLMPELAVEGSLDNPFEETWSEFTPKVNLRYRYSPELMAYALYTRGFRAGGFSGRANTYEAASLPYGPETVDNFELGIKSEWFDRRLRFNAAAYFMKYDEKQEELSAPISQGVGQQTVVINAASVEIKGLELELLASPTDWFIISAMVGILDAEYTDFVDPVTGGDLTFLELKRAPDLTASLSPTFQWPLWGGELVAQATWHFIDELELQFYNSPQSHNDSQNIVDASISFTRNNTTIGVYGLNLTEEDAWANALDVGRSLDFGGLWTFNAPRPPRFYGIRLVQKF